MNPEHILKTIVDGVVELEGIDRGIIKPESLLAADLGLDSLDYVELLMLVEDELDIVIHDDDTFDAATGTVQKLVDFIQQHGESV